MQLLFEVTIRVLSLKRCLPNIFVVRNLHLLFMKSAEKKKTGISKTNTLYKEKGSRGSIPAVSPCVAALKAG